MFDKPTVDSYRQITAPPALRDNVMALSAAEKPAGRAASRIISIAAAAACLLLVAVGAILGLPADDVTVAYNGTELSSEPIVILPDAAQPAMLSARTLPPVHVVLSVSSAETTEISVTNGFLIICDISGQTVASGTDCTVSGTVSVEWTVGIAPGLTEAIRIGEKEYTVAQSDDGISTIREA